MKPLLIRERRRPAPWKRRVAWSVVLALVILIAFIAVLGRIAYGHELGADRQEIASLTGIPVEWLFGGLSALGGIVYVDVRRALARIERRSERFEEELAAQGRRLPVVELIARQAAARSGVDIPPPPDAG